MNEKKLDRRRKYYMVLDCETATLPCATDLPAEAKKNVAIAKPLIYDFGWTIVDAKGVVYRKRSFLITEIFSVPAIFNTAYYAWKRPIYLERLANGETTLKSWAEATEIFMRDAAEVEALGAFNSMFDFKKAIPFTELYISKLYSPDFYEWEAEQTTYCKEIAKGFKFKNERTFEPDVFRFHNKTYPLFDLWGLSCEHLLNNPEYKQTCIYKRLQYIVNGCNCKSRVSALYLFGHHVNTCVSQFSHCFINCNSLRCCFKSCLLDFLF